MYGLAVNLIMSLSGHPSIINEILFFGRIGSISYVLPIRQNSDILNRDIRVVHYSVPLLYDIGMIL